jgi:hypothetical protein
MKIRCIYKFPWFWGRFKGITLYPFILFKDKKEEVSEKLFRHEMEHVYQIRELGWFKFYWKYLRQSCKVGYDDNKFEVMARKAESSPLTPQERRVFALGKEV